MSDFAEDMQAMREYQQKKKAANLKTNSELILFLSGWLDFKVKVLHETHIRLFHPTDGYMDIWPSTKKGRWYENKIKGGRVFKISDVEEYIMKHFKQ